ncbi:hypothetical protein DR64_4237 [Paraburkholderia xenovorans LB400]|uniref:Exported protein n=1 Tax=Paraburkholderia xenovorans (strain LB400) TaxID=266265 RepID=Q13YF3_PARXL|nr:DUF2946 domain-containing protein [Paraburkholderia xenovorans]ABE30886.1 Putative exported protein [Paraburkholderia xenovorans LB400]AIP30587.1 hypothetical protein DR64_4237 [Paraburkholderia xenovorans LB400]
MSRFYRKIGSWLGLFAILMATLAPTISHTLAARSDESAMSGEHCDMPSMASTGSMDSMDSMPSMSAMQDDAPDASSVASATSGQRGSDHTRHTAMSDGDACGYCSLLAHMPVVPSVEALFVVTVRALQHTAATRFESVRRVEPLTFAQPRAPPFAS